VNRAEREEFVREVLKTSVHNAAWIERKTKEIVDRWEADVDEVDGDAYTRGREDGMEQERDVHFG
jgi:hypothetical protein